MMIRPEGPFKVLRCMRSQPCYALSACCPQSRKNPTGFRRAMWSFHWLQKKAYPNIYVFLVFQNDRRIDDRADTFILIKVSISKYACASVSLVEGNSKACSADCNRKILERIDCGSWRKGTKEKLKSTKHGECTRMKFSFFWNLLFIHQTMQGIHKGINEQIVIE